ncbi:hypothetical protein GCM10017044_19150 [Kordiimonas sediminis]|uniref:Uncharacterized protein n=1 Tax=Kordiimonas sediminis TaxID=1735581 RepID=A0A919ATR6_9PROT|nr:hypothetical protein [Kordiimonas sediminis]GHF24643.1 hypothetical protein GCM10017044_19150 [Kordiimonas sediminis]
MARPLPDDLQKEIADTATKAEVRSVAIFAFIVGMLVGGCIAGALISDVSGDWFFAGVAVLLAAYWYFSSRRRG